MSAHATPLCIDKLLPQKKIAELFCQEIQYSTLVCLYRSLNNPKLEQISDSKEAFLDLLIEAQDPSTKSDLPDDSTKLHEKLKDRVQSVLTQKIRIGLMAMGRTPLSDISTSILQHGPRFVSEEMIERVCREQKQFFSVTDTSSGKEVQIQPEKVKSTEENAPASSSWIESQALLKTLYRTRPDVVIALSPKVTFRDLLQGYIFWEDNIKEIDYVRWLLRLAHVKDPNEYPVYRDRLYDILKTRIMCFLHPCPRTIGQITENLCIGRPKFITDAALLDIIHSNPKEMCVDESDVDMRTSLRLVKVASAEHKPADVASPSRIVNNVECIPAKIASAVAADPAAAIITDFDLSDKLACTVQPLLSTRVTCTSLLSNYTNIIGSTRMRVLVEKYGCFVNYLIEYAKAKKPKFSSKDFMEHLYFLLEPDITKARIIAVQNGPSIVQMVRERTPVGLLDDVFIGNAIRFLNSVRKTAGASTIVIEDIHDIAGSPQQAHNPIAGLESERVFRLLTKQPRFGDIRDVFGTLPASSVSLLASNSMSFFEWLISLCKRLMPHDSSIFETHLQNILRSEVAQLHLKQHCQMTIQHVHSVLCENHTMLLSPNFIGWCLEQESSSFCVYQSWIYIKNALNGKRSLSESEPCTSSKLSENGKSEFDTEKLLGSVRESKSLSDLLKNIAKVPLANVGCILQNTPYWYDYFENNLRERLDRQILSSLLAKESKFYLEDKVLKLDELTLKISKGLVNFISVESLEYVLSFYRDVFAMSGKGRNCFVAAVRHMKGDDVDCSNSQDESLLRQILIYFPTTGSCDWSTMLGVINKEDSFLHKGNQILDPDYLRCFFLMFPMLFYLRGETVVLTCLALDMKARYKNDLYPTSTTGNKDTKDDTGESEDVSPRKRSSRRRRSCESAKKKRRRRFTGEKCSVNDGMVKKEPPSTSDVIVIDSDEETFGARPITPDESEGKLIVDEKSEVHDNLREAIENLPISLVADMTSSILLKSDGRSAILPLLRELLTNTVGPDEGAQIEAAKKLFQLFKEKIIKGLRLHEDRFVLVSNTNDKDVVSEVRVAEEGEISGQTSDKPDPLKLLGEDQVEEITSTVIHSDDVSSPLASLPEEETSPPKMNDVIWLPTNSNENPNTDDAKSGSRSLDKEPLGSSSSSAAGEYIDPEKHPDSEEIKASSSGDLNNAAGKVTETHYIPTYTNIPCYANLPGCDTSEKQGASRPKSKSYPKTSRQGQLLEFFKNFLQINAGSVATELLIADAYRRFQTERFARSRLAFEGYVFDFALNHTDRFVMSGTGCTMGVSKISYRRALDKTATPSTQTANLSFMRLAPEVCTVIQQLLKAERGDGAPVDSVCDAIRKRFNRDLAVYPQNEIQMVVRCLVLVTMMHNLKIFRFAVGESVLHLRHVKEPDTSGDKAPCLSLPPDPIITAILGNSAVREAVLLMAKLLATSRPLTQKRLRDLWQAEAPQSMARIFGSGLSFMLSLRKYACLFSADDNGIVKVDESAMEIIRRG